MFLFSKYFLSPVCESDRYQLAESFGLAALTFEFAEIHQGTILRLIRSTPARTTYEIEFRTQAEWEAHLKETGIPGVARIDGMTQVAPPAAGSQLWRQLFPFPLKALAQSASEPGAWYFSDVRWESDLKALLHRFEELEAKMDETELSVLLVEGAGVRSELLFHFVRKRLVSWSLVPELGSLWTEKVSPELLKERFGTTAQIFHLDVAKFQQSKLISDLADALLPQAEVSTRPLFAQSPPPPATQFEL